MIFKRQKPSQYMLRPFRERDMIPPPPNWRVGPPDFVGVASGKAGTTWWYRLLIEHPSVKPNRLNRKELGYFYHFGYKGMTGQSIETYRKAFAVPEDCICGEWSPGYLNYPLAIDYLAKTVPETKILVIVRNPVDQVLSAQNQMLSKQAKILHFKGDRDYLYKTFSLFQVAFFNSFLHKSFQRLLELYDRSRILMLQYEKCKLNPDQEINKTYRFLNIDDGFIPPSLYKKVNKKPYLIPKLDTEGRARLAKYFYEDVLPFIKLFPEIDLSLWKDF
jgi:hypothetical protein